MDVNHYRRLIKSLKSLKNNEKELKSCIINTLAKEINYPIPSCSLDFNIDDLIVTAEKFMNIVDSEGEPLTKNN